MCRSIYNFILIALYLAYFFSNVCLSNGNQGMTSISKDIESLLKRLEDQANQQLEKDKICNQANITNEIPDPEDNVIKVIFKLQDKKFQDCFKYFKIILEKKRKVIREVKVPFLYDTQEEISYRFENISCGIYEVFVQPCFDDGDCPLFRWLYQKSINVTNDACMTILQSKITPGEDDIKIHALFITVCLTVPVGLGALFHIYKRDANKRKYIGYEYCAANYKDVKVDINENFMKEMKSIFIYIFHKYDDEHAIKKKVIILKESLELYLKFLLHDILKDVDSSLNIIVKTIESELLNTTCLDNVNNWLSNALKKREMDGMQRCILVETNWEMEEEDILENEIFSYVENELLKFKNNNEVFLKAIQLKDKSIQSEKFTVYSVEATVGNSSHPYYDLLDFCFDVCSEFVTPSSKTSVEALFHQYLHKQSNKTQNSSDVAKKIFKINR